MVSFAAHPHSRSKPISIHAVAYNLFLLIYHFITGWNFWSKVFERGRGLQGCQSLHNVGSLQCCNMIAYCLLSGKSVTIQATAELTVLDGGRCAKNAVGNPSQDTRSDVNDVIMVKVVARSGHNGNNIVMCA